MADSTSDSRKHSAKRRRFAPVAIIAGLAASAAIATTMTGALGAFTAQITNSNDTATTGTLIMGESGTGGLGSGTSRTAYTCTSADSATSVATNTATCATINKYGGSTVMIPGTPVTSTVTITNNGSVAANTFTLTAGACSPVTPAPTVTGGATDACAKMALSITQNGTAITLPTTANQTGLNAIANKTITLAGPIAPGASSTFVFSIVLPSVSAAVDNTYQGVGVSQPLTWQFTS